MYYIYHIPDYVWKNGRIGKIGASTQPEIRVKKQGYTDYEILEEHSCIYKVSDRELELQKQYGYPIDSIPYYQSRQRWGSYAGKIMSDKRIQAQIECGKRLGKKNIESGHIKSITKIGCAAARLVNMKEVAKLDKQGNLLEVYESVLKAAEFNKRNSSTISNNIANRTKYCGGFKYIWKKDLELSK